MPDSSLVPSGPSRLVPWMERASFCIPWLVALATASPRAWMADDVPLLRSLGHVPIGFEGLVTMGLAALFDFLPLGSRALRVAWAGALGVGVLGWLLYRVTLACQRHEADSTTDSRFPPALALATALTAGLGPLLAEGTIPGGASVGAALALASVLVGVGVFGMGAERPLKLGLLLGACLLESRGAFGAAVAVLLVYASINAYLQREAWSQSAWLALLGSSLVLGVLPAALLILALVRPEFGLELALASGESATWRFMDGSSALNAWSSATGLPWCGISLLGLGLGVLRASIRPWLLALGALLVLDTALAKILGGRFAGSLGVMHLLGIPALAVGGALGVTIVARWLGQGHIAFSRPIRTLLVVYAFTLSFVSAEASSRAANAQEANATDAVTDELWRSLPPRTVLMVRSEPLLFRLLASRISRGSRPDVLVLSMPHLERGGSQARRLAYDPALVPLVRDMLLNGRPSEFALSELADRRVLYLEPDLRWDSRLFGHVLPRPFFGEFASHPLGRSDRKTGLEEARDTDARVLALLSDAEGDEASRALVALGFRERALMLATLGDRELARLALNDLLSFAPKDELGLRLKAKLDEHGRGPIALSALTDR